MGKRGLRFVAIGGGTGLSSLLRGLKKEVGREISELSAIVTVADSGGSTGKLRRIYKIPAPGDIRNCIVALSDAEDILRELFQYRFKGEGLEGHAFGNLFLTALTDITGSFLDAVRLASKILNTKGEIIPSTAQSVDLVAKFEDGTIVKGEEEITEYGKRGSKIESIWLEPQNPPAPQEAVRKIKEADVIVIGPGSLFTSIIPNFLVGDVREAVKESNAFKIFVVNAMTQPGETDGFTAYDHLKTFLRFSGLDRVDAVIVNTKMPSDGLLRKYLEQNQEPVTPDISRIARENVIVYAEDLIGEDGNFVRHDPEKLAGLIMKVVENELLSRV
ncbi:MAG: YvcK family protein [Aquificae bacterium]|nr:YvcK family protein [Aquificota bacterium]